MKIYLETDYGWTLFELDRDSEELRKRDIIIEKYVQVGYDVYISPNVRIGYNTQLGNYAQLGYGVQLGNNVKIEDNVKLGYYVQLGNNVELGNYVKIEDNVKLGNYVQLGNNVEIEDNVKLGDNILIENDVHVTYHNLFSPLTIIERFGVAPEDGWFRLYKAVTPELKSLEHPTYQYTIGGSDRIKIKRDQSIECGEGFHFTSFWRARVFADNNPFKIISALIHIDDVMAIHNKVRARAYKDVKVVDIEGLI